MRICDFLLCGKCNAIESKRLADLVGVKSIRVLQDLIAVERAQGEVILSTAQNGGGYFLPDPEHPEEVEEFCRTLSNRAKNTFFALRSAKRYLKEQSGG